MLQVHDTTGGTTPQQPGSQPSIGIGQTPFTSMPYPHVATNQYPASTGSSAPGGNITPKFGPGVPYSPPIGVQLFNPAAGTAQPGGLLSQWRENLAIIASNRTTQDVEALIKLGDRLWQETGQVGSDIIIVICMSIGRPHNDHVMQAAGVSLMSSCCVWVAVCSKSTSPAVCMSALVVYGAAMLL